MLFMVTNRRIINGKYGDEEKQNNKYEYQFAYNQKGRKPVLPDGIPMNNHYRLV